MGNETQRSKRIERMKQLLIISGYENDNALLIATNFSDLAYPYDTPVPKPLDQRGKRIALFESLLNLKGYNPEQSSIIATTLDSLANPQPTRDTIPENKHLESYTLPYSGFEWQSRHAQIKYLRSQWPTQQHIMIARMFFEWFRHESTSMDHERASAILRTSVSRASAVLLLMKRRKHVSRKRERYGKHRYPYVYILTEQGKHYGRYIWEHQLNYNLEMMDQLREVAFMSSPRLHDSKEEYERNKLTIDYSVVNYDLKCQMDLDKRWKR